MSKSAGALTNRDLHAGPPEAQKPSVRFAFDFPELVEVFEPLDAIANRNRKDGRRVGYWAVGLVLAALLLASADPLLEDASEIVREFSGYAAAGLGMIGTALGLWSRSNAGHRFAWLRARMQTEHLRLFNFFYIAERAPSIVAASGDREREAAYEKERAEAFARLTGRVIENADRAMEAVLSDMEQAPLEGLVEPEPAAETPMSPAAEDMFAAWRRLRIVAQLEYCEAKLDDGHDAGFSSPMRQEHLFSWFGWICIGAIVTLHLLHLMESVVPFPRMWI